MNRTDTLRDMTSWTDEQLETLCKPENHKIIFDGYEYFWHHKLNGNKWEIHSVYSFDNWKKPYSWMRWALGAWAKELAQRREDAVSTHFKSMKSYLNKVEQARLIASDSKLKTKDKIAEIQKLLPEESITAVASIMNMTRQAIHKHL